jgi:predicted nucleic acid-binding protein
VILDTTVLVDLLRRDDHALEKVSDLEEGGRLLWVPSPSVFELFEGIERADRPRTERTEIENVLDSYTILSFETVHARQAGRISGQLVRRGEMLDPIDVQIAGLALVEDHPVLTGNVKDFERVPDLDVVTY